MQAKRLSAEGERSWRNLTFEDEKPTRLAPRQAQKEAVSFTKGTACFFTYILEELSAQEKPNMLHRKIYQLCCDGREICVFLRDQQRWIERARIVDIEGDLVTIRYETEEEDELSSWEEMVRLESIGSVTQKLASVPRGNFEPLVSDDCPEAEQIHPRSQDSNQD
jgi:hypothetical protein